MPNVSVTAHESPPKSTITYLHYAMHLRGMRPLPPEVHTLPLASREAIRDAVTFLTPRRRLSEHVLGAYLGKVHNLSADEARRVLLAGYFAVLAGRMRDHRPADPPPHAARPRPRPTPTAAPVLPHDAPVAMGGGQGKAEGTGTVGDGPAHDPAASAARTLTPAARPNRKGGRGGGAAAQAAVLAELAHIAALKAAGGETYRKAVQCFAAKHVGLAKRYAAEWFDDTVPREDLIQVAMIGVLEAVRDWDPLRSSSAVRVDAADCPFVGYAKNKVRAQFQRWVWMRMSKIVPVPRAIMDIRNAGDAIRRTVGESATDERVIAELSIKRRISKEKARAALSAVSKTVYEVVDLATPEPDEEVVPEDDETRRAVAAMIRMTPRQADRAALALGLPQRGGRTRVEWGRDVLAALRADAALVGRVLAY